MTRLSSLLLALVALSACTGGGAPAPSGPGGPADPLADIARREGAVQVVVQLAVPQNEDGAWDRKAVARAQRRLLDDVGPGARVRTRAGEVPQITLRVTPRALDRLRASPLVVNITLDDAPP